MRRRGAIAKPYFGVNVVARVMLKRGAGLSSCGRPNKIRHTPGFRLKEGHD